MRDILRTQHYSIRTGHVYVEWARGFILFRKKRHPKEMSVPEFEALLNHLTLERRVAALT